MSDNTKKDDFLKDLIAETLGTPEGVNPDHKDFNKDKDTKKEEKEER